MILVDQIDDALNRSYRWMTPEEIGGSLREMFGVVLARDVIRSALLAEQSFGRYHDQYCVNLRKRADRLAVGSAVVVVARPAREDQCGAAATAVRLTSSPLEGVQGEPSA